MDSTIELEIPAAGEEIPAPRSYWSHDLNEASMRYLLPRYDIGGHPRRHHSYISVANPDGGFPLYASMCLDCKGYKRGVGGEGAAEHEICPAWIDAVAASGQPLRSPVGALAPSKSMFGPARQGQGELTPPESCRYKRWRRRELTGAMRGWRTVRSGLSTIFG
jgi:hypothetical protein